MTVINLIDFSKLGTFEGTVTFVGYLIVFLALISLVIIFTNLPKIIYYDYKCLWRKCFKKRTKSNGKTEKPESSDNISGEMNAAISTALYLYFNQLHDEESNVVTIDKVQRRYSPWSSKIYNMNNTPFRRGF
jgi:hypothetical protein